MILTLPRHRRTCSGGQSCGKRSSKGAADIIIAGLAAGLFAIEVNPILVILLAAVLGVLFYRDGCSHGMMLRGECVATILVYVSPELLPAAGCESQGPY
ncbi:MAG: hypothetical protein ACLQNE_27430 [Thermoguttaceae bacterium]